MLSNHLFDIGDGYIIQAKGFRMVAPTTDTLRLVGNRNTPSPIPSQICSISSKCQTPSLIWVVDQDQLNPYVAYEGYVVRVPHNPLLQTHISVFLIMFAMKLFIVIVALSTMLILAKNGSSKRKPEQ